MPYQRYLIHHPHHQPTSTHYLPTRRSPLAQHSYSCDARLRLSRTRSFMAFLAKWSGLDLLRRKLEERLGTATRRGVVGRLAEEEPALKKARVPTLRDTLPLSVTGEALVTHALDKASDLADTGSPEQYIYVFDRDHVAVHRDRQRIELDSKLLGRGSFAQVRRAYDGTRGIKLACKLFPTQQLASLPRMQVTLGREIEAMWAAGDSPFVVRFEGLMVTREHVCILMELIEGEEFFDYIIRKRVLGEEETRPLLFDLVRTLTELHAKGIVHRDLKLENIMVTTDRRTGLPRLRLIDFGLARSDLRLHPTMQTRCGSEEYAAPEILLAQAYNPRLSDAWSFGVILYACLMGALPFNPDMEGERVVRVGPRALCTRIVAGKYYLPEGVLSREASALIKCLLVTTPQHRMSLEQALHSSFFKKV